MDFSESPHQEQLLRRVDEIVEETGGRDRAKRIAIAFGFDDVLEQRLLEEIDVESLNLLDRVLIADRLAELGTATTFGLRGIVDETSQRPGPFVVVDRQRNGLGRYAASADSVLVLDGEATRRVELAPGLVQGEQSGAGYPFGRVADELLEGGAEIRAKGIRARWALALAVEIGGLAAAAVSLTGEHLQQRNQFGKPLAQFQALRHRIAEIAVKAEATRWMARGAAHSGDERSMLLAASYAASTAAELSPEVVQLWGARGFAHEFGISTFTMRIQGLRFELGSQSRLALAVLGEDGGLNSPTEQPDSEYVTTPL